MHKALVTWTLIVALASLQGCGGSSDDDDWEDPWRIPLGLWTSTTFDKFAMVGSGGTAILIRGDFTPGSTPKVNSFELFEGWWRADSDTGAIVDDMRRTWHGSSLRQTYRFTATHAWRSSIIGSLTGPLAPPEAIDLRWDPSSDRPASIAKLTGIWILPGGSSGFTLTVDTDGRLQGNDAAGCFYDGRVSIGSSDANVYSMRLEQNCGGRFHPVFVGLAALMRSDSGDDVLLVATRAFDFFSVYTLIGVMQR